LFASVAYQDSSTVTEDNGSPAIVPFKGQVYSALASANYILNNQTDLKLTYDYSSADYSQNNVVGGLPLGIDYQRHGVRVGLGRQFWKRFRANLEYAWYYYREPSSGGFNDYTAHGIFGTLAVRWD
jgi:outer membrane protein assembly factor BamA